MAGAKTNIGRRRHLITHCSQFLILPYEEVVGHGFDELFDLASTFGRVLAAGNSQGLPIIDSPHEDVLLVLSLELVSFQKYGTSIRDVGEVVAWDDLLQHVGDLEVVHGVELKLAHLP